MNFMRDFGDGSEIVCSMQRRVEDKGTAKFHPLVSKYKSLGLNNLSPVEKCCFDLEV